MTTNYPTAIDDATVLPNISSSDDMNTVGKEHDVMHTNLANAVLALETKVGADNSTDPNSVDFKVRNSTGVKAHFGVGHPSTFFGDGDLYFDTSSSNFVGYVQQLGQLSTQTDTVTQGQFSSAATGSASLNTSLNETLLIFILCYENASNSAMSVTSLSSPNLTWTHYVSNHCTFNSRNHYIEVWYAPNTQALTSETVSWSLTGGNVDDAIYFFVPVDFSITSGNPFIDGGSTGLPSSVPVTANAECTTGTIVAPAQTLLIAIQARDDSTTPNAPTGFTSIATQTNGSASRWEYGRVATMTLASALNGTITSSGLAGSTGGFVVLAVANNPSYRSWQPFT